MAPAVVSDRVNRHPVTLVEYERENPGTVKF